MMVELIDDFFAEYPAATGELRTVDSGVAIRRFGLKEHSNA
jgi:hypothetical protein